MHADQLLAYRLTQLQFADPHALFEGLDRIRALYGGLLAEFGVIDRGDSPGLTVDALHCGTTRSL